jgi:hypothetical protein
MATDMFRPEYIAQSDTLRATVFLAAILAIIITFLALDSRNHR